MTRFEPLFAIQVATPGTEANTVPLSKSGCLTISEFRTAAGTPERIFQVQTERLSE
jgi:hypothetical protein